MAGLTSAGFVPDTLENIKGRIEQKIDAINPGFDFSPESPDGQLINIMAQEIQLLWSQLDAVHNSYNPSTATGQSLRNLGLLTGLEYNSATRSSAVVSLAGTAGTQVPRGSIVASSTGAEFVTTIDAVIPTTVLVIASVPGPEPVAAGAITTIVTNITGWTSVSQSTAGSEGQPAQSEQSFRQLRNDTVLRNAISVQGTMGARLAELGLTQVSVFNNDLDTIAPDGTPPQAIHVIAAASGVPDEDIGQVILDTKGLGVETFGTTTVSLVDKHDFPVDINFSISTGVRIIMSVDITYLESDTAGLDEIIKQALADDINSYQVGDDVVWSRLFGVITQYGKAQVNTLTIAKFGDTEGTSNIVIESDENATLDVTDIVLTS